MFGFLRRLCGKRSVDPELAAFIRAEVDRQLAAAYPQMAGSLLKLLRADLEHLLPGQFAWLRDQVVQLLRGGIESAVVRIERAADATREKLSEGDEWKLAPPNPDAR